jgi:hypothetical protein
VTISVYEHRFMSKHHVKIEGSDLSKKVTLVSRGHRIPIQANGLEFIMDMDSMHPKVDIYIPKILVSKPTTGFLLNFGDTSNPFDLRFMMMLPRQVETSKGVFINRTELKKEVVVIDNAWVFSGLKDNRTEYAVTITDARLRGRLVTGRIRK